MIEALYLVSKPKVRREIFVPSNLEKELYMKRILIVCIAAFMVAGSLSAQTQPRLKLATTTSTDQSGLLSVLLPVFEQKTGITVDIIAVGTGAALKLGENGDADVLLVHARKQEEAFMAAGYGEEHRDLFYNDFIILGPEDDPASIKNEGSTIQALRKIAAQQAVFISRGDASGTHVKENELWAAAGLNPAATATQSSGAWYKEAGQGMSQTIMMADQMQGYTLADRATWLAMRDKCDLLLLHEGDKALFNPYGIIVVSQARYPGLNTQGARALADWMESPEAQNLVKNFTIHGLPCFFVYGN